MAGKIIFLLRVVNLRYFMDKPLVTEACSDASDAENSDPLNLPHVFSPLSITEVACFEFCSLPVGCILKLFCVALPVGYCELCFYACMVFACIGYREV